MWLLLLVLFWLLRKRWLFSLSDPFRHRSWAQTSVGGRALPLPTPQGSLSSCSQGASGGSLRGQEPKKGGKKLGNFHGLQEGQPVQKGESAI